MSPDGSLSRKSAAAQCTPAAGRVKSCAGAEAEGQRHVDLAGHRVERDGAEVKLTATEFKLLAYLAANAGRVLTHQSILSHVWGEAEIDQVEYLRVYMRQLRKKLEVDPAQPVFLLTEPGVGYRFVSDG